MSRSIHESGVSADPERGCVYLVGAGPGDPGLLTRHGADALAVADVVVYDRLVDNSLLAFAPPDAELVYAGKQAGLHALPQEEVNRILGDRASEGKRVVRLKGGDPFVFGRGGEEAAYLRERGIRFVVVPGVTAAVAVPAYAGIPVTDRGCASSFAVITGHEDPSRSESRVDWPHLAKGPDTLVFMMALANLGSIADRLISEGRPANTPAAVIERGTTPGQRVVTGELRQIAERAKTAVLHPPALLVVGDVVRLRDNLAWFGSGPLAGKRILMPRARHAPSELARLLQAAGGEVTEIPLMRVQPDPPRSDLRETLRATQWVLFTSPDGVDALLWQLKCLGHDVRVLAGVKLAAIGARTSAHLARLHLRADQVCHDWPHTPPKPFSRTPSGSPSSLADWALEHEDRVSIVGETEEVEQAAAVIEVDEAYRLLGLAMDVLPVASLIADARSPLPPVGDFDAVVFVSPSTVRNYQRAYGSAPEPSQLVVSIGPTTSAEARHLGIRIDAQPAEARAAAAAQLIIGRLTSLPEANGLPASDAPLA